MCEDSPCVNAEEGKAAGLSSILDPKPLLPLIAGRAKQSPVVSADIVFSFSEVANRYGT